MLCHTRFNSQFNDAPLSCLAHVIIVVLNHYDDHIWHHTSSQLFQHQAKTDWPTVFVLCSQNNTFLHHVNLTFTYQTSRSVSGWMHEISPFHSYWKIPSFG